MSNPVYWNRDCTFALLKGVPLIIVGFVFCLTIIGLPIGLILVLCSGVPLARVQMRLVREEVEAEFNEYRK
jgi:uncharacterized membrane protein YccF (DUF307 family)